MNLLSFYTLKVMRVWLFIGCERAHPSSWITDVALVCVAESLANLTKLVLELKEELALVKR